MTTCSQCGEPFRMPYFRIKRKKREGKPTLCSLSCRNKYYNYDQYLTKYEPGHIPWNKKEE